jgi:RNA recognition motif-containing protein
VVKATVLTRTRRGKVLSTGSGLVEFNSAAEAAAAINQLSHTELDGRKITVREDRRGAPSTDEALEASAEEAKGTKVFVRSLSWDTTDDSLREFFSRAGHVLSATIRTTSRGRSTGTGVVEFADADAAAVAIDALNNQELDGRTISVREFREI